MPLTAKHFKNIAWSVALLLLVNCQSASNGAVATATETNAGWVKYPQSPVLGGRFGTIFDISVLKEDSGYIMLSSWRPQKSIALHTSKDGFAWSDPESVLLPDTSLFWQQELNRPGLIKKDGVYHLWFTGQANDKSWIGYATSTDLHHWKQVSDSPVVSATLPWEKTSVMCPAVIWDEQESIYKMWYSGGEDYEPDAIGYATSVDGRHWKKYDRNPVFKSDPQLTWEQAKVTACQVIKESNEYLMFYIGFRDVDYAQIGIARSRNGIDHWERHPVNPVIRPGTGWDSSAVYKPYTIFDGKQWLLWYNGRNNHLEQIGMATHAGKDLGFKEPLP